MLGVPAGSFLLTRLREAAQCSGDGDDLRELVAALGHVPLRAAVEEALEKMSLNADERRAIFVKSQTLPLLALRHFRLCARRIKVGER